MFPKAPKNYRPTLAFAVLILVTLTTFGCVGLVPFQSCPPAIVAPDKPHVILLVLENQKYEFLIGNDLGPYLNELAAGNGLATNFFANTHPSIGNYFMLTTGQIISNSLAFADTVQADNLAAEMCKAGVSWKSYQESLPSVGYTKDGPFPYAKTHNPFAYFNNILLNPEQKNRIVPFTQFAQDLAAGTLPNFSYIIPNQLNNMHNCPDNGVHCTNDPRLEHGDAWLKTNLTPLLEDVTFRKNGLLIITFDESWDKDSRHGGGHVPTILIGPNARKNFKSTTFYQHESILRLISDVLKIKAPGAAASAPNMSEFLIHP